MKTKKTNKKEFVKNQDEANLVKQAFESLIKENQILSNINLVISEVPSYLMGG